MKQEPEMLEPVPKVIGIESLPCELLDEILSYLIRPAPSLSRLHDQPVFEITHSKHVNLKSISCVSRKFRQAVLLILFQHIRLQLRTNDNALEADWPARYRDFLAFTTRIGLQSITESFTLVVEESETLDHDDTVDRSDSISINWQHLFRVIDPLRLTIVASPPVLGFLAAQPVKVDVAGNFHMPYHILSLSRSVSSRNKQQDTDPPSTLLQVRPWESLVLNEGSFIRVYSVPHFPFVHAEPPSILPTLVSNLPRTIRSVSYIATFPVAAHLYYLYPLFVHLQRFFFQLIPRSDVLPDIRQRAGVNLELLTFERDASYIAVLQELASNSTGFLSANLVEVECGDVAVDTTWKSKVTDYLLPGPDTGLARRSFARGCLDKARVTRDTQRGVEEGLCKSTRGI